MLKKTYQMRKRNSFQIINALLAKIPILNF